MRFAVTGAVLLAVVATALVAVCQHSETRRLQHRVWQLERRRVRLEKQAQRLAGTVEALRTPRRLLVEHDLKLLGGTPAAPSRPGPRKPREAAATPPADGFGVKVPAGFVTGGNFEGEGR